MDREAAIEARNDREMILHPLWWPHIALPLKRGDYFEPGNTAVFCPHNLREIDPNASIEIRIGNLFQNLATLPVKTYPNVDALLADGWIVD